MNFVHKALAVSALVATLSGSALAFADEHHDHPYVRHDEWKKGYHMKNEDWSRGEKIDWHHYHLRQPPHGYEWREVDGNYVLAAVATGIVASVVVASTVH
jgi:Ni/Co efflux regulator RcnB